MRRTLALLLIVGGGALLLVALGAALFHRQVQAPGPEPLPEQLAGLPLVRRADGEEALDEIAHLHGQRFTLTSGSVGAYGAQAEVTLWVTGAPLEWLSGRLVVDMQARIAEGRSPFSPVGTLQVNERSVHEVSGMGQRHFYFQSGANVVWLAANHGLGESALMDAMAFYP